MYENNNTVSIDWKGLFIKIIIVALIVFAIFKGYEYFSNNKGNVTTNTNASQLFNANLESLKQAGENYFDYKNYPSEGQTVMVTLGELVSNGDISELYDEKGNVCSRENSYVAVTNEDGQYKLKATLACGNTTDFKVDTIGCECEENVCTQNKEEVVEKEENKNNTSNKEEKTTAKTTKKTTKKTTAKVDNLDNVKPTTKKTTTTTTKKTTTTTTKYVKTYKVVFDSNGGTNVATQYVEKYDTANEPRDPEKDNANFAGWYYNGRLWDFDNEITKDIRLEAYYWETKTINKTVYTAAWDTYGTTYVTVTHKLAIPAELKEDNIKNVRIKKINNERTMTSANDLYNHTFNHSRTFDGYISNGSEYQYNQYAGYTLGRLYNIDARKTYSNKYDRWVTWTGYVSNQCQYTIDGTNCNYGIVYNVVWEYQEFTD